MVEASTTSSTPAIIDTGYRAVCPACASRHKAEKTLIGRERAVLIERCPPCEKKFSDELDSRRGKRKRYV